MVLIAAMIDDTPLMKQFVGAYVIGTWVPQSWFARMREVKPCERAFDTGCVATWSTLLEGADADAQREGFVQHEGHPASLAGEPFVCTNPLSWSRGTALAPASENLGGWVPGQGRKPLAAVPHLVSARCDDGALFVSKPDGLVFNSAALRGGNYHNYDYQLAYMNIRQNAADRVRALLAKASR
jgi:hypothetical protein